MRDFFCEFFVAARRSHFCGCRLCCYAVAAAATAASWRKLGSRASGTTSRNVFVILSSIKWKKKKKRRKMKPTPNFWLIRDRNEWWMNARIKTPDKTRIWCVQDELNETKEAYRRAVNTAHRLNEQPYIRCCMYCSMYGRTRNYRLFLSSAVNEFLLIRDLLRVDVVVVVVRGSFVESDCKLRKRIEWRDALIPRSDILHMVQRTPLYT